MLTHRNKKPYECTVDGCPKSYCDARSLRRHEENHHHLKGLPALKDKDSEKEARRRNSKTILSLLSTPSSDSSAPNLDTSQGASLTPPLSNPVTEAAPAQTTVSTASENSASPTAPPSPTVKSATPPVLPSPTVCPSPVATPLPSPTALSPPVRPPPASPITVPTVRHQLVAARVVPSRQPSPQQGMQFRLVLDQSFPQSPGAQGTLLLSRSPPDEGHPNGVLSAYLSPTQQLPQIQLAVSQPQLLTSQVQQLKVSTAARTLTTEAQPSGSILTGLPRQVSVTTPEKNEQMPKLVQSVTWPQVFATSSANQTTSVRLSPGNSQQILTSGKTASSQEMSTIQPLLSTAPAAAKHPQLVKSGETFPRQGVNLQMSSLHSAGANQAMLELKDSGGYQAKQQARPVQKKSGLAFEIASTSTTAPVSTTTTSTTTTAKSTVALTPTSTKSVTSNSSTKQSTNSSTGILSGKTVNVISARQTQPIHVPTLAHEELRKSPKAQDAAALANQSKPVACNLCNRRFKNIPALNGHMRLHGGYFKKESESKRSDKRESAGPPLQTASVSVRQLIEEKIIQKRGGTIGRVALLAGRENAGLPSSQFATSTASTTETSSFGQSRNVVEARRLSEQHELTFKKLSMTADSLAAASVLQHHNYANSSFPTPPHSTSASNTPPLTPLSPLSNTAFLPLSPQSEDSNQLLIHSEDPLLSSTIKDITRKKIDLGSLTVLGSVLVERGGQLHLIQAPTATVQRLNKSTNNQPKSCAQSTPPAEPQAPPSTASANNEVPTDTAPEIAPELVSSYFKSVGIDDEEYLHSMEQGNPLNDDTPTNIPGDSRLNKASSNLNCVNFVPPPKRPRLMPKYPTYKSRLRNCRRETICSASMPYTPAPMLDPNRSAAGLVASVTQPWHLPSSSSQEDAEVVDVFALTAPESDSFPHVNVGAKYQCPIPPCDRKPYPRASDTAGLKLYEPSIEAKLTNEQVISYLEFACCDAIPFAGRNQEYALHLLHLCGGDIPEATMQLMIRKPKLPRDHGLLGFNYGITKLWGYAEVDAFVQALKKHAKNWPVVAKELGKSPMHCIQFYYVWKKVCLPEYCNIRDTWEGKVSNDDNNNHNNQENANSTASLVGKSLSQPLRAIVKEETREDDDEDATLDALALIAEDEASLSERETQETKSEPTQTIASHPHNDHFNTNMEYLYNKLSANEELDETENEVSKEENALHFMSVPLSSVSTSHEENLVQDSCLPQAPDRNVENSMPLHCEEENDGFSLAEIKTEPWAFCEKDDLKPDIISVNVDINDPKLFLDEFDDVKLNLLCENTDDLDETVEEAPIIVPKPELLESNPHDEVKREIESMMAMHGIRMEGEEVNEAARPGKLDQPSSEQLLQTDATNCLTEEHVTTTSESRLFICGFADCSASFNSRAALNGHIRIHGYRKTLSPTAAGKQGAQKDFACETCGKTFGKAKNRNAHKKIHRLWDQVKVDQGEKVDTVTTSVSSSAEAVLTNSSPTISFSTCLNFGLNLVPLEQLTPLNESQIKSEESECKEATHPKEISCVTLDEKKITSDTEQVSNCVDSKDTTKIEDDMSKQPTAAQLDEIFSSLLCDNPKESLVEDSKNVSQNHLPVQTLVKPTM